MKNIIAISILAMMLGACSSGPFNKNINKGIDVDTVKLRGGSEVPEWFFDYPKDDAWVYGVATGHSEDMQFAIDKGIHDAKVMIADKLQNYINGDFKRYIEDSGSVVSGNTIQQTTKMSQAVIDQLDMGGYMIVNKVVVNEGPHYRSFILMKFDRSDWYPPARVVEVDKEKIDEAFTQSEIIE